jgi:hypothetical protein
VRTDPYSHSLGFCTHLLCPLHFFPHDLRPPSTAMAAELPPSRFKTMGSLASLRRLMGWQAPGLACKVKSGAASLANMRPGDFVFFAAYALAGLVPPLSSFLTLLEYYGLQLQHLSPNSVALVAIFVHLCEMYVGVWPLVRLFQRFFVPKAASTRPPLIGGHYFQLTISFKCLIIMLLRHLACLLDST